MFQWKKYCIYPNIRRLFCWNFRALCTAPFLPTTLVELPIIKSLGHLSSVAFQTCLMALTKTYGNITVTRGAVTASEQTCKNTETCSFSTIAWSQLGCRPTFEIVFDLGKCVMSLFQTPAAVLHFVRTRFTKRRSACFSSARGKESW